MEGSFLLSLAAVGLLLLVPIISMTEAAVIGVNRAKIRQLMEEAEENRRDRRRSTRLDKLLEERARLLTAIAVLRTLVTVLGGLAVGAWTMLRHQDLLLNYLVAMLAVLFLEIVLRRIANARSEAVALAMSGALSLTLAVTAPMMDFFLWLTRPVTHLAVTEKEEQEVDEGPTEDEIRLMVEEGRDIEETEKEMIHSIFELGETIAKEIMIPRVDMVCIEVTTPLAKVLDLAVARGHSRLPVFEENIDNIVGMAYTRDLLTQLRERKMDCPLREVMRPAYIVHGTKKVDELLRELQREKVTIAVVVDEYGGTDGLVTMEDLIEEIVGEITDEYDTESKDVERGDDGSVVVDARMIIEDVNELLETHIPVDDYETIGGYVYGLMGKVPGQGDEAEVDGLIITAERVQRQRIVRVKLRKIETEAEEAGG